MLRQVGKDVVAYGVAAGVSRLGHLILFPYLARHFGPAEYGAIELATSIVLLASVISMLQLESAIGRFYSELNAKGRSATGVSTALWPVLLASIVAAAAVAALALPIAGWLGLDSTYRRTVVFAALCIPPLNVFSLFTVVMRFRQKPWHYGALLGTQVAATAVTTVWLVGWRNAGVSGVLLGQGLGYAVGAVLAALYLRDELRLAVDRSLLREYLKYSLPQVPAVGISWLNTNASRFVLLSWLSVADVGVFAVGQRVVSVVKLADVSFRMAWGPVFWETYLRPNHREIFKRAAGLVVTVTMLLVVTFSGIAEFVTVALAGSPYLPAVDIVRILSVAAGAQLVIQAVGVGPEISKRTIFNTLSYGVGFLATLALLVVLVPLWGADGAAWAVLGGSILTLVTFWWASERAYYIGFDRTLIAGALALTTTAVALQTNSGSVPQTVLLSVGACVALVLLHLRRAADLADKANIAWKS